MAALKTLGKLKGADERGPVVVLVMGQEAGAHPKAKR